MNRIIKAIAIHLKCLYYKIGEGELYPWNQFVS